MDSYQSLHAWRRAHSLLITTLRETDAQVVSVETNIVEGYALRAPRQFRKHLWIALGSAAESETLLRGAGELGYLSQEVVHQLVDLTNSTIGLLRGLLRRSLGE